MILDYQQWINSFLGGSLIGISVTLMLIFKGRETGINGILYGTFSKPDKSWRYLVLIGLILGGVLLQLLFPESLSNSLHHKSPRIVVAGLLVGFGTLLGNGCTSGHGVCGISRFSLRSIFATLTFITAGIAIVALVGV